MRNLRNIRYNAWDLPADLESESLTASCWDPAKDEVLCAFGPSAKDGNIRLARISEHVKNATDPKM
jgi:elongator complex protein 1